MLRGSHGRRTKGMAQPSEWGTEGVNNNRAGERTKGFDIKLSSVHSGPVVCKTRRGHPRARGSQNHPHWGTGKTFRTST